MTCNLSFPQPSPPFPGIFPAGIDGVPGKTGETLFRGFPVSPPTFPGNFSGAFL